MPENVLLILASVAEGPKTCERVVDDISRDLRTPVQWRSGSLAATLRRLETLQLVQSSSETAASAELARRPRRVYTLTESGRERLDRELAHIEHVVRAARARLAS